MTEKCDMHSGVCEAVSTLKKSDEDQWESINGLKKTLTSTLTAVIITLVVALLNLAVMLTKIYGS